MTEPESEPIICAGCGVLTDGAWCGDCETEIENRSDEDLAHRGEPGPPDFY